MAKPAARSLLILLRVQQPSQNMDPVLSSTVEFDNYIKSNLNIARSKVLSARSGSKEKYGKTTTSNDAKETKSLSKNQESKGLSQDFLKMNINKYHHAVSAFPKNQTTTFSRDFQNIDTPAVSLQHSWKAHLAVPRKVDSSKPPLAETDANKRKTPNRNVSNQNYMTYDDDWDLDWDNLQPLSPVSEVRTNFDSLRTEQNPLVLPRKLKDNINDSVDFGAYKVRLVVLKRVFSAWNSFSERSCDVLLRKARDVSENCVYWPKRSYFTWWQMLYSAAQQMKMHCKIRVVRTLFRNRKKCRRFRTCMRKAAYHDRYTQYERFMGIMRRLGMKRRLRTQRQRKEILAYNFRNLGLARKALRAWMSNVAQVRAERLINEEQAMRKDKIALFMKRVQNSNAPIIPSTSEQGRNISVRASSSSSGGGGGDGGAGFSTTAAPAGAPSRSRGDESKGTPYQQQHQQHQSKSASGQTSGRTKQQFLPRSPPKSLRHPLSPHPPTTSAAEGVSSSATAAAAKSLARHGSSDFKFSDSFEGDLPCAAPKKSSVDYEYDDDGFEDEDEDAPPPSYDTLMRKSQSQISTKRGDQQLDFSSIRLSSEDRGLPPLPPLPQDHEDGGVGSADIYNRSLTSRSAGPAASRRSVGEAKQGAGMPHTSRSGSASAGAQGGGSLEERAAARRQRTLLLKKQAEERIQEKQQQKLAIERQKHVREIKEAEMIRKEARAKQLQTKQLSDRSRAEQTDHLKELLTRAKKFRHTQLLIHCGIAPWQRYMEMLRLDSIKAVHFRNDRLLLAAWSALLGYIVALRTERFRREHRLTGVAVAHYRRKILKAVWRMLRMHHRVILAKTKAVTGHFSRFTLCRRSFGAWRVAYERSVRLAVRQYRSVQPRGDLNLQRHFWRMWCAYHRLQLEEREIRQRVNSKWAAVQGWMSRPL